MNSIKTLWSIAFLFCSQFSFSQTEASIENVKQAVKNEKDYTQKIALLQDHINKIYLTQFDETIELTQLGYDLAKSQNDKGNQGEFLRLKGGVVAKKGNIDSALVHFYKALDELENTGNSEKLGLLYDDIARMYRKLKQSERALSFYDKALAIYEAENNLEGIDNPRIKGRSLVGNLKNYWRYRIGDYRLITKIDDSKLIIIAIECKHRKEVYKK